MQDVSGMFHKREIGVRNDTYTRAEIDAKDGAIQAAADKAQQTADSATEKNRTQDTQIAALQKTSHTHSNKDVLDKAEQPYTTAERDKLAGLENYTHPTHTAYSRGLYNITVDSEGHIISATAITKGDITSLGIPGANTTYTFHRDESLNWAESQCNKLQITKHESGVDTQLESIKLIPTVRVSDGFETSGIVYFLTVDSRYCKKDNRNETMWNGYTYDAKTWIRLNTKYSGPVGYKSSAALESEVAIVAPEFIGANATNQKQGLMSPEDKKKLDGMDLSKYLPLSGGVMTGNIDMATKGKDVVVGSHRSTVSELPTAVAGGTVSKKLPLETGLTEKRSLAGSWLDENNVWQNILSVRHRNGWNDGPNYGFYLRSLLTSNGSLFWNKQTGAGKWQGERVLLDSTNYSSYAAKSDHTHAMIANSAMWIAGAHNAAKWYRLGVLVSSGNFSNAVIRVWSGDGANGNANQNASFEIQIKDGWQSTESATKACGVTVYRINCGVKVKVIPTAHDTYTVWTYLPWTYWNGNYAVYGRYKSWTSQQLIQSEEPEGTGADTAYYDQAFLTSTVAKATEATALTDSGWVAVSTFMVDTSAFSQIAASFRKYGDIVFFRGRIQPKSNMTSISLCSTTSTILTSITPSHSVRGVGVSSDGLTPFHVNITTSPSNSVILTGNFSANKIYDFEFSYMK